jgi:RNA polymerase sigma-70 factor (ECF subfamily)
MAKVVLMSNSDEFLNLLRKGDSHAQRTLFEQHHKRLFAICYRYLKDHEDAYDATQTSFIKIFEKIKTFSEEGSLKTWMNRISINTCIDIIRKNKNYKNLFISTDDILLYGDNEDNFDIDDWWNQGLNISSETIYELLNKLPKSAAVVFNLFAVDEYSHKQIAEKLNISIGTSKWHLNNARTILKDAILKILKQTHYDAVKERY